MSPLWALSIGRLVLLFFILFWLVGQFLVYGLGRHLEGFLYWCVDSVCLGLSLNLVACVSSEGIIRYCCLGWLIPLGASLIVWVGSCFGIFYCNKNSGY